MRALELLTSIRIDNVGAAEIINDNNWYEADFDEQPEVIYTQNDIITEFESLNIPISNEFDRQIWGQIYSREAEDISFSDSFTEVNSESVIETELDFSCRSLSFSECGFNKSTKNDITFDENIFYCRSDIKYKTDTILDAGPSLVECNFDDDSPIKSGHQPEVYTHEIAAHKDIHKTRRKNHDKPNKVQSKRVSFKLRDYQECSLPPYYPMGETEAISNKIKLMNMNSKKAFKNLGAEVEEDYGIYDKAKNKFDMNEHRRRPKKCVRFDPNILWKSRDSNGKLQESMLEGQVSLPRV